MFALEKSEFFSLSGEKKSKIYSISKTSDSQVLCQKLYKTQDKNYNLFHFKTCQVSTYW